MNIIIMHDSMYNDEYLCIDRVIKGYKWLNCVIARNIFFAKLSLAQYYGGVKMIIINGLGVSDVALETKEKLLKANGKLQANNIDEARYIITECISRLSTLEEIMDYSVDGVPVDETENACILKIIPYKEKAYLLDGKNMWVYDGEKIEICELKPIPV
jgi:hypothetical protein